MLNHYYYLHMTDIAVAGKADCDHRSTYVANSVRDLLSVSFNGVCSVEVDISVWLCNV
jgi:hypothetical protein